MTPLYGVPGGVIAGVAVVLPGCICIWSGWIATE